MEGLDPQLVDLFNEKQQMLKEDAQMQIDNVTNDMHQLSNTIEKYKSLKPENYSLMEMSLSDIFEGVAVIEPLAFPVWTHLLGAYPKDHFSAIIKQVAEQLSQD